ncbi:putative metal-binding membrane protein [Bradyrhizobium sp. GM24.11]
MRLNSTLGAAPLGILISLIVLTGIAWGLTLYQASSMSLPMDSVLTGTVSAGGMEGMQAMEGMAMTGMSAGLCIRLVTSSESATTALLGRLRRRETSTASASLTIRR